MQQRPINTVTITIEEWEELKNQVRQFKALDFKMKNMYENKQQSFYLLSTLFLEQWKAYVKYHMPDSRYPQLTTCQPPKPFNSDIVEDQKNGATDPDSLSPFHNMLKKELVQNVHFIVISREMMELFQKKYKGYVIKRKFIKTQHGQPVLQKIFTRVKYIVISNKINKKYATSGGAPKCLEGQVSQLSSMEDWLKQISQYWIKQYLFKKLSYEADSSANLGQVRIWLVDSNESQIQEVLKKPNFSQACRDAKINVKALTGFRRFSDAHITESNIVLIEYAENGSFYVNLKIQNSNAKCQWCSNAVKDKGEKCQCEEVIYCSIKCLESDEKHQRQCRKSNKIDLRFKITTNSLMGICGLRNLCNTCYMNTALQCLSGCTELVQYFGNNQIDKLINKKNPLGSQGQIAFGFAFTLMNLWCGQFSPFSPTELKNIVDSVHPMFSGTQQHDSQQFLMFLLDKLHQDFNRVPKHINHDIKAIKDSDDWQSEKAWSQFLSRNQSPIIDMFAGQYKSKLKCLKCNHESVTFQSFMSIPLPVYTKQTLKFFFIGYGRQFIYYKVSIELEDPSVERLTEAMAKLLDKDYNPNRLKFFELGDDIVDLYSADSEILSTLSKKQHLFCIQLAEDEVKYYTTDPDDINKLTIKFYRSIKIQTKSTTSTVPVTRPFWFKFSNLTVRQIEKFIWKWIYKALIRKEGSNQDLDFSRYFVNTAQAPLRFFLKIVDIMGKNDYYKSKQQLQAKQSLRSIRSNYPENSKFELECNVDNLNEGNCRLAILGKFADFPQSKLIGQLTDTNILQCFQKFRRSELLAGYDKWFCPSCKSLQDTQKNMGIYKTGKYLIVQLRRFKQINHFHKVKLENLVKFDQVVDLSPFIQNKNTAMTGYEEQKSIELIKPTTNGKFHLFAVINHFGRLGGGHYTAYVRHGTKWHHFNDSDVEQISAEEVCTKDAYVLFFCKV